MSRSLLIVGPPVASIDAGLCELLSKRPPGEPAVILDYLGRAAPMLRPENAGELTRGPVTWADLADRRRPCPIFRLRRSIAFRPILYFADVTWMLFGDAKAVIGDLVKNLAGGSGMH